MKVKIRTADFRCSMPVPAAMIGYVIRWIPDRVYKEIRVKVPEPYSCLVTKDNIGMILTECLDLLKENKGMEIVHVEASDGTFVSIRL